MQVVILAAGLGSRLGKGIPKALVEVAGKTMLEYQMEWVKNFNPEKVIVVSGYHHDDMKSFCNQKFPHVILVENERYKEQNLYSLLAAKDFLNDDTLIMNVDHIYPDAFAQRVAPKLNKVGNYAIFADTERSLTDDDMKVFINSDKKVEKISKKLTEWNAGYIGMTFIRKSFWKDYFKAAQSVSENHKEKAVVEMVIQELVTGNNFPEIINSDNITWYEIDTPQEHEFAEKELSQTSGFRDTVRVVLIDSQKDLPEFAGTDIVERWERQLNKLNVDLKHEEKVVKRKDLVEELKDSDKKKLFVFSDWIVDDFSLEFVAETVFSQVKDNEAVFVKNSKYGISPFFIAGVNAQKELSDWKGFKDDIELDEVVEFVEENSKIEFSVQEQESGFWKKINDERSATDVEWQYLQFLQFRPGGLVAKYLNRPISIRITKSIIKYKWITPNIVTGVDFLIGLIALSFFLIPSYWTGALGAILFHFNSIVDGVDGEVARMRQKGSSLGAWLDSICDETLGALLYLAIGYHLYISGHSILFLFAGIFTALVSYSYALIHWHCKFKNGLGFYYWWECYKPRKEVQRSTSIVSYLKKLLWRDSILFAVMIIAILNLLDVFLVIVVFPAVVNLVLIIIHIFVKKARW